MRRIIGRIFEIIKGDEGQGMAEYGLILFLIVIACIAIVATAGGNIKTKLTEAADKIGSAKAQ